MGANGTNGKSNGNGPYHSPAPGRTPKLAIPAVRTAVLEAIANSMPLAAAAALCRISEDSIYYWLKHGRTAAARKEAGEELTGNDSLYCDFYGDALEAHAEAIGYAVRLIRGHAVCKFEAARYLLERALPKSGQAAASLELLSADGDAVPATTVDLTKLSADELRQMQALVEKAKPDTKALPAGGAST